MSVSERYSRRQTAPGLLCRGQKPIKSRVSTIKNVLVGWEEIDDYPDWQEVEIYGITLDDEESMLLPELFQLVDKLAGWPQWIDLMEYPNCPTCNKEMNQLIFQIDSEDNIHYMWGNIGTGYIIQCSDHKAGSIRFLQISPQAGSLGLLHSKPARQGLQSQPAPGSVEFL